MSRSVITDSAMSLQTERRRPLRVVIIGTRGIPSGYSGYENFAEELAVRLVERGHHVLVYCRRGMFEKRPREYRGVQLVYHPSVKSKNLSTFLHAFLAGVDAIFRRPDVALFVNVATAPFCMMTRLGGIRTVLNVDGMEWLRPKWSPAARRYFRFSARIAKYAANILITDAQRMREIYEEEFGAYSEVVTYGANPAQAQDPELVCRLGLEPGRYFLSACRLVPDNNIHLLVEAFTGVDTSMKYAIAGGTPYRDEYIDRLKDIANERVVFLGHIDDQRLIRELHCNAYAYLHAHQYGGTNPSLLKALACGNCVLALNTSFNREVLADYGLFFERNVANIRDRLAYIVDHPEVQEKYAGRARQRIYERYTWESITDSYEKLFYQLQER